MKSSIALRDDIKFAQAVHAVSRDDRRIGSINLCPSRDAGEDKHGCDATVYAELNIRVQPIANEYRL